MSGNARVIGEVKCRFKSRFHEAQEPIRPIFVYVAIDGNVQPSGNLMPPARQALPGTAARTSDGRAGERGPPGSAPPTADRRAGVRGPDRGAPTAHRGSLLPTLCSGHP